MRVPSHDGNIGVDRCRGHRPRPGDSPVFRAAAIGEGLQSRQAGGHESVLGERCAKQAWCVACKRHVHAWQFLYLASPAVVTAPCIVIRVPASRCATMPPFSSAGSGTPQHSSSPPHYGRSSSRCRVMTTLSSIHDSRTFPTVSAERIEVQPFNHHHVHTCPCSAS